jgi:hypothetical protein
MINTPIKGWMPYKLEKKDGLLRCHWLNAAETPFTEPFFDQTIINRRTLLSRYIAFSPVSDLAMMREWAGDLMAVEPSAFIFHISRCGSTLVSQLLSTSPENIVLAEVPFFDQLLRLPFKDDTFDKTAVNKLLTDALKFYGQDKTGSERRVIIKADSWHLMFHKQLRELFPAVPFILMYRRPDEVYRSHSKKSGIQMVRGLLEPQLFGLDAEAVSNIHHDKYIAVVLENFLSKTFEIAEADNNTLLINYHEGPMEIMQLVADFINLPLSEFDLKKMEKRSQYHSKDSYELFNEEALNQAPVFLNKAMGLYQKLEAKRISILLRSI